MPVAYSSSPERINCTIASRSGDGDRSLTRVFTRVRTILYAAINDGELSSGARKSIAWQAQRISTAITLIASCKARSAFNAACMLMLTWSSLLADVGIVSTDAGWDSVLISDASAAARKRTGPAGGETCGAVSLYLRLSGDV